MSVIACPSCGSGTRADASHCWLCGAPLAGAIAAPAAPLPSPVHVPSPAPVAAQQKSKGSGCFWIGGIIVSTIVLLFVGLEIGLLAPGLLIPYAVLMVPIMIVFGRMVYIQLFRKEAPPAPPGQQLTARGDVVQASGSDTGAKVATGIAMGLVGVVAIVGILILLFIAAVVILFIVCIAAYS